MSHKVYVLRKKICTPRLAVQLNCLAELIYKKNMTIIFYVEIFDFKEGV